MGATTTVKDSSDDNYRSNHGEHGDNDGHHENHNRRKLEYDNDDEDDNWKPPQGRTINDSDDEDSSEEEDLSPPPRRRPTKSNATSMNTHCINRGQISAAIMPSNPSSRSGGDDNSRSRAYLENELTRLRNQVLLHQSIKNMVTSVTTSTRNVEMHLGVSTSIAVQITCTSKIFPSL